METTRSTIRMATADDSAEIAALLGELGYPADEAFVRTRLQSLLSSREDAVFVAEWDGELAGFLSFHLIPLFHTQGRLGRITALSVSGKFQRRGVGKAMISAAEALAWENDCERIEVTSGDARSEAHAFYRGVGYQEVSRRFMKSKS